MRERSGGPLGGDRGREEAEVAGSGRQCAGCAVVLPAATTTVESALRLKSAFSSLARTIQAVLLAMHAKRRRLQILAARRPIAHV